MPEDIPSGQLDLAPIAAALLSRVNLLEGASNFTQLQRAPGIVADLAALCVHLALAVDRLEQTAEREKVKI